ncbi:MAG: glycosyltransferase family 4 protein [Clostridium sp.]|nr:glycosyltransferase family 4 protein [Clostridium sp.]
MKFGIDSRSINLHAGSGIGTYTKNLVENLLKIDNINKFNLIWTGNVPSEFIKDNVDITLTSGKYSRFYETYYIPNLMKKENMNLYHLTQNGIGFPFEFDIPVVVTVHDLIPYTMPETVGKGYLNKFLKEMPSIISLTKGIITVSEYSKKDIIRFFPSFPEDKIFVTPLATNDNFKPISKKYCKSYIKKNYMIDSDFILYIGGFSSRKNVKGLILAFSEIKNSLKKPHKLLIGGSLRDEGLKLKEMVTSMGLENDVIFTGYLDDSILPIFYNASEAFIYPSLYEGFGLPPLEAMSCGTPVITSNLTSIPEVTENASLLINPFDINELSYTLLKLLNDESLKNTLKIKGLNRSKEFSWKKTAKETLTAYNKLCDTINQ